MFCSYVQQCTVFNLSWKVSKLSRAKRKIENAQKSSIPWCAGQVLSLDKRDVIFGLPVHQALGQPEVNNVDQIGRFAHSHQEVVRFDVPVSSC